MRKNSNQEGLKSYKISGIPIFLWILTISFDMMTPRACLGEEIRLYSPQGKRDPFVALIGATGAGPRQTPGGLAGVENIEEIRVEGIVIDSNPRMSVVIANGTMLKEGDEVGNVKLIKIQPDVAVFSVNGIEGISPLYQEESKS